MARRRIDREPTSRLAIWARRCAIFSLIATALVIVIVRAGLIELDPSLAAVTGALAFAGLAILLAVASLIVIWREGIEGVGAALLAVVVSGALLAYPVYMGTKFVRNPAIADVTTDMGDPPRFDQVARLRPRGTVDYPGAVVAARQHAAYPDIEPLQVSTTPQIAYEAVRSVIHKRFPKSVIMERAPQGTRRDGQIEAVARTPILGFREDVVIRIRAATDGARIDVRSASRHGRYDLGSNAARVRNLLEDIDDQVSILVEEQKKRVAKPVPQQRPPSQPVKR